MVSGGGGGESFLGKTERIGESPNEMNSSERVISVQFMKFSGICEVFLDCIYVFFFPYRILFYWRIIVKN